MQRINCPARATAARQHPPLLPHSVTARRRSRPCRCAAARRECEQQQLSAPAVRALVSSSQLLSGLLGAPEGLVVEQLMDGVINLVWRVQGSGGQAAIIKQALPYVRAVGESFPLDRERMDVEAAAMQLVYRCCPAHVPRLLAYDAAQSILTMECCPPPHQKLLFCIRQGQVLPGLASQLSTLLTSFLAHTSLELLQQDDQAAMVARFRNADIVAANERVVLVSPFDSGDTTNRWSSPELDGDVRALWADAAVLDAAARLLHAYRTQKQALIHNDLHAGNLLAAPGSLFLIDYEFATIGPVAFDLGCLTGNLMLAVLSLQGMAANDTSAVTGEQRLAQARWLLQVLQDVWVGFVEGYPARLQQERRAAAACNAAAHTAGGEAWQQQLLADSCGYAGCTLIRLTIGLHHYPDIESIRDDGRRAAVERACLQLGRQLLLVSQQHPGPPGDVQQQLSIGRVQQLVAQACGGWL